MQQEVEFLRALDYERNRWRIRTVDVDGNAFRQDKAISADKGGNLAQLVQRKVLGACRGRDSLDQLDIEVVGLGHGQDTRGARVLLHIAKSGQPGVSSSRSDK